MDRSSDQVQRPGHLCIGAKVEESCAEGANAVTHPAADPTEDPRFVMVHGAWHGPWCWDPLEPHLRAFGLSFTAVELPGRDDPARVAVSSLNDFAQHVVYRLRARRTPAIVVAHSFGGIVASKAAEMAPELFERLIYVAAFVPRPRVALAQLVTMSEFAGSRAQEAVEYREALGINILKPEKMRDVFYGRCTEDQFDIARSRVVAESLRAQRSAVELSASRFGEVDKAYVECAGDRAIPVAAQREMARLAGVPVVASLDADHSPFLSQPAQLAQVLSSIAVRSRARSPFSDR
jgi:pimeloyl-ACP methyl ester carboxylesterase